MKRLTSVGAVVIVAAAGMSVAPAGASLPTAGLPDAGAARLAILQAEQGRADQTAGALALGNGEKLVVRDVIKEADGIEYVRYDRTFNGLEVIGGDLLVRRAGGAISKVTYNAGHRSVAVASTSPRLSEAAAESKGAKSAGYAPKSSDGKLVVFAATGRPVLAYEVVTTGVKAD